MSVRRRVSDSVVSNAIAAVSGACMGVALVLLLIAFGWTPARISRATIALSVFGLVVVALAALLARLDAREANRRRQCRLSTPDTDPAVVVDGPVLTFFALITVGWCLYSGLHAFNHPSTWPAPPTTQQITATGDPQ